MVKNISVRKLRANLAGVLKGVNRHMDRYIVSNRGEPEAVIMCIDDYEGWLETLEIMSSKEALKDIRAAKEEISQGKLHTFGKVFKSRGKTRSK